jgi:hypothetical protein
VEDRISEIKILKLLENILPEGFEIYNNFRNGIRLDKKQERRIISIGLGDLLNKAQLTDSIQCFISFYDIESILNPNFLKTKDIEDGLTIRTRQHRLIFNLKNDEEIYDFLPLKLHTDESLIFAEKLIKKYIQDYAEPFFNYWNDIRCFLSFIENATLTGLHDYFAGYAIEKKLIIWHLCSHPKFNLYSKERRYAYENYLKDNPNDNARQKEYKELLKLLKRLEKISPLYKWDESYLISKPFSSPM